MSKNRSHLVPTTVVNKNGTTTTVHKKPDSSSAGSSSPIPPVALQKPSPASKQESGMELLEASNSKTAKDLHWLFTHHKKRIGKRTKKALISDIHEDTFAILDREGPRPTAGVVSHLFDSSIRSYSFAPLNNLAVVIDVMNECDEQHFNIFSTYVDGLQMYRAHSDPYIDWSEKSASEQEIPKALIRAAMGLDRKHVQVNAWVDGNPRHLIEEELTQLIMDRPKDVQRIIDILNQRDLPVNTEAGIDTLKGLLDQETENPLMSGLL